jgi:thiol:disulfide interchange protein
MRQTLKIWLLLAFACTAAAGAVAGEREIYPAPAAAQQDIAAALKTAAAQHKRVILDFGGNWCPDCRALDLYLHDTANQALLQAHFVLVHVNIGADKIDENLDIAARYDIPITKGVPALAVLGADGKLIFSQKSGEFESMRHMQAADVTGFLDHWKPAGAG